jgi:ABC-type dipeptide/oligopeptide/nickel transport system permease subunit
MSAIAARLDLRRALRFEQTWPARIALALLCAILALALFGPFFAPHSPSELVGAAFSHPSGQFPLGTDYLGEDILSRVLWGGRSVIAFAALATGLAYLVGAAIGLVAGFRRGLLDSVLMRTMDVLLAFPPILFLLLLATGAGPSVTALVLGIAIVQVPSIARIIRTATLEVAHRQYVEAALARGDSTFTILRREILPNISGPITADAGPRFTISILLVAAVNFLGLGLAPPAADWAIMISENRTAITIQPWAVLAPALLIAALTVSLNVVADAVARSRGRSLDIGTLRR